MSRWNGEPDHSEPVDPGCPCGTCSGYMAMLEEAEYREHMARAEEEAYYAQMEAEHG